MLELPNSELPYDSHVTMSCDQARELRNNALTTLKKLGKLGVLETATLDATAEIIELNERELRRIVVLPKSLHFALKEITQQEHRDTPADQLSSNPITDAEVCLLKTPLQLTA